MAGDLRLAKAGMVTTALLLAISTAGALAAGSEWSGPLAMASMTFWGGLGVNGLIAVPVSWRVVPPSFAVPFWLAAVAVLTCGLVLWHVMKRRVWRRPFARHQQVYRATHPALLRFIPAAIADTDQINARACGECSKRAIGTGEQRTDKADD